MEALKPRKRLAIFISGNGSNAKNLYDFFDGSPTVEVALLVSDNKESMCYKWALEKQKTTYFLASKDDLSKESFVHHLQEKRLDLIVLAGFLKKIPRLLVRVFDQKIINLHPSLLPKYGGKGMYGDHVHKAVLAAKETQSGITIHWVNEQYDQGAVIFQKAVELEKDEQIEHLRKKIQRLEHEYLPKVVEQVLNA